MSHSYPKTRRDDSVVESLHGTEIHDPYRWLEDPDSAKTADWVRAQNECSEAHLSGLAARSWFTGTLRRIVLRPRAGVPRKEPGGAGSTYFLSRNDGTQDQDVWFVADSLAELVDGGRMLVDPNTFSEDGTTSLAEFTVSDDGRWLAYLVSEGGSDWHTIRLLDPATGVESADVITQTKFGPAVWLPDNASFLYKHFPVHGRADGTSSEALAASRLQLHRVGRPQDEDELVLEFPDEPRVVTWVEVSHDGRWAAVHIFDGTDPANRLWLYPIGEVDARSVLGDPIKLVDDADAVMTFIRSDGDVVYLQTDRDAPRHKLVRVDLSAPDPEFLDVVPESIGTIEHTTAAGDELLIVMLQDATPQLRRYRLDGEELRPPEVRAGAILDVGGHVGDSEVFIGVSSVTSPLSALRLDLRTGVTTELTGLVAGEDTFVAPEVCLERRRAASADGTEVRYFLITRDDLPMDRPRPTLQYGYGGFDIAVLADFRAGWPAWLLAGGVLVLTNLRGGGEYGSDWHDGGRLANKQNVFDDFIAVAEHLVAEGITTPDQLALHGRSNGGLLVGAVLTQRPELAAVALPMVGVLDMLRFHLFTIGAAWCADFGSPDVAADFAVLHRYSPLHNVTDGTEYPATLICTGDHDDRVVPAHSFKFTAALQHAQSGPAPVLARIEVATGHGLGKPAAMLAAEWADQLAFAAEHTGLVPSD